MSRQPNMVKNLRYRTWGSATRLVDEWPIPMPLYHGGRGLRWLWQNPRKSVTIAAVWALWVAYSLTTALLIVAGAWILTAWVGFRRTAAEGRRFDVKDALSDKAHRRDLHNQWGLACEKARLTGPQGGGAPALRQVKSTGDGGLEAVVHSGKIGVPVPDIQKQVVTLSEVIGCREVLVLPVAPGVAKLTFHWRDLIGRVLPLADLPVAPVGEIAYGRTADGEAASIKMNLSVLMGGLTEYGKSNIIHALIADLLRQGVHVRLYISDPKMGVELREYGRHLGEKNGLLEVVAYAKEPKASEAMFKAMAKDMAARTAEFEAAGLRSWEPSEKYPLCVAIVDELMELEETVKNGAGSALGQIARLGRVCGFTAWMCSQSAQLETAGRLRDFVPQRIALATRSASATDMILGNGAAAAGAEAHSIRLKGEFYALSNSARHPVHGRAALVTDEDVKAIAAGMLPAAVADMSEMMQNTKRGETALYRHFDAEGRLLYVGITNNYARRSGEHAEDKPWWRDVARSEVERYPTRKAALEAEKRAIIAEHPLDNDQHNGANPRRRRGRTDLRVDTRLSLRRRKAAADQDELDLPEREDAAV